MKRVCWMTLKCSAEPKRRYVAQIAIFAAESEPLWRRNKMYPKGQESSFRCRAAQRYAEILASGSRFSLYPAGCVSRYNKPGDRVAVEAIHSCVNFGGTCPRCMSGQFHMCDEGMTHIGLPYVRMLPGGYGEYSAVHKDKLHKIPDNVSLDEAALLDILVVNVHAVRLGDPQLGECCVVYGCGVVGLSMIQVLYAKGIRNLIAIAKYPYQAEIAKKCGAAHVVLYKNKEQVVQDVMALTGGNGADQTYECVGGSSGAINDAAAFTTRQGKIVMMGIFAGVPETDLNTLFMKEISLIASNSYGMSGYRDEFAIALEMLAYKQVDHNLLISHRFKPEQYVEAIEAARGKDKSGAVKVLFERD